MCGVNFTLFGCEEKILSNVHIVQWTTTCLQSLSQSPPESLIYLCSCAPSKFAVSLKEYFKLLSDLP